MTLCRPHLFFGLNKSKINNLQKVQNAAARLILRRRKTESITHEIRNLHWLRINERIAFKIIMIIYKFLNNLGPADICKLIEVSNFENLTLKNVFLNTKLGCRSFSYVAPKLWNALPLHLRLTQTFFVVFQVSLKNISISKL